MKFLQELLAISKKGHSLMEEDRRTLSDCLENGIADDVSSAMNGYFERFVNQHFGKYQSIIDYMDVNTESGGGMHSTHDYQGEIQIEIKKQSDASSIAEFQEALSKVNVQEFGNTADRSMKIDCNFIDSIEVQVEFGSIENDNGNLLILPFTVTVNFEEETDDEEE